MERLATRLASLVGHRGGAKVSLWVNGHAVPLREFPAAVLARALLGMLSELKGVEEPREILLRIRTEGGRTRVTTGRRP